MGKLLIFNSTKEIRFINIIKFIIPTYLTSLFNTVYTIVDGIFVSKYVGTDALAAINIVYPIVNILTGIALAFSTGGSAIAAIYIGSGKKDKANEIFSICIIISFLIGCIISILFYINLPTILKLLGATQITFDNCKTYALWWLIGTPVVIGKELFTYFIRVDGSSTYSFSMALSGGILNIILDYIFVGILKLGVLGAVLATILGLLCSFSMGIYYFIKMNNNIKFIKCKLHLKTGFKCILNGISEFINQLSIAITTIVFNKTAMNFLGEDGIASVSIIMYLQFLFIGIYFGYSMGISPLIGYSYGNKKIDICNMLEKYSYIFLCIISVLIYALTFFVSPICVSLFAEKNSNVYILSVLGMRIYGLGFLFSGINIFTSIRMIAYGKGYISGTITFLRSFALLILFLIILPNYLGINGIWLSVPFSEFITLFVSILIIIIFNKNKLTN